MTVLDGVRVLDLGGIGPGPFATMMLADMGAEVIRLDPPKTAGQPMNPVLDRGKRSVTVDFKSEAGIELARSLAAKSEILVEGFRPGAAERLGLGPDDLHALNPALVYGRITGYGQDGPKAQQAGHDLGYIASAGLLNQFGRAGGPPQFPANLIGDFGGGGMLLVVGVLGALTSARTTGVGTVVDSAMVEGANLLYSMMHGFSELGMWRHDARGHNLLDSGAPFYDVYPTADGRYVTVACIEGPFFAEFVRGLGIEDRLPEPLDRLDHWQPQHWPSLRTVFAEELSSRTLAELEELFSGSDACVEPVRTMAEAKSDEHNLHRGLFCTDEAGIDQPAPAPRFSALGEAALGATAQAATAPDATARGEAAPDATAPGVSSGGGANAEPPRRAPVTGADTEAVIAELGL
ncbi:CaiB/BaiF CoA transferase family protein [Brevibacterium marinum]|uniref:Alpha-methylacyl-CoA racemase n=1 Tax=Brevibacterium marinum TaxID=418643 RepID=A0A846RUI8_9MICO|nr:CaiB/BaiF CoA-transferase family protein [Brevibacterium marinum]NJC55135.1 alpha-methylacyl-CoA racemase [Brevibacterium marinum]